MNVHRSTRAHRARVAIIGAAALGGAILPAAGLGATSALAAPVCTPSGLNIICTFTDAGTATNWTVPTGVTSLTVSADGAGGAPAFFANPSFGGETKATLSGANLSGAVLSIFPGVSPTGQTGGTDAGNGGGTGGTSAALNSSGGGGGGATTVSLNPFSGANLLLEAGGGGGAAALYPGGSGGGGSLLAGFGGTGITGGNPGLAGSGGTGGSSLCGSGGSGSQFTGGTGANGNFLCPTAGGGGGGGYYGGGGGGAATALFGGGGGGGSAYAAPSPVGGITVSAVSGTVASNYGVNGQVTITYAQVATTTTLTASPPSPSASGTSVTFTAVVSPNDGGGTVNFKNGGSSIAGCSAQPVTLVGVNYQATCTTSSLPIGTNPITAVYSGDTSYAGSTSAILNYKIIAATTTTLTSNHNPSYPGQSVTFTATVSPTDGGGHVEFKNGASDITGCSAKPLTLVSGSTWQATCTTSSLPVGSNAISAVYSGDTNYATSTGTLTQVVRKFPTNLAASIYFNAGQTFTVTATLTSLGSPVPGQTVSFSTGSHFLGTATTDTHGVARRVLNGSQTLLVEENGFTIAAEFPGSGAYYPSFATAVISMFP
jgi:hypothetical protein